MLANVLSAFTIGTIETNNTEASFSNLETQVDRWASGLDVLTWYPTEGGGGSSQRN